MNFDYQEQVEPMTPAQAWLEASRCLLCKDAPCTAACPAGVDAMRFIRAIRFDNLRHALDIIRESNVLAGICGTICPHENLCEGACSATELYSPIKIGALQRFAADRSDDFQVTWTPPRAPACGKKVAVIGAGPAGLGGAAELARKGVEVTVFESRDRAGGVVNYGVPRFRLADRVVDRDVDYVRSLGVEIRLGEKAGDPTDLLARGFDAVLVAVGLGDPVRLGLPGEELDGVHFGLDFIRKVNQDLETAAERLAVGKRVVIQGAGQVGLDLAEHVLRLGAEDVLCLSRRGTRDLREAAPAEFATALDHGVQFLTNCRVTELLGEEGRVTAVKCVRLEWVEVGGPLPPMARDIPGTEFLLPATSYLQAAGQRPEEDSIPVLLPLQRLKGRVVKKSARGATSIPGVWVAGDIAGGGGGTIVRSVAEGRDAAREILEHLGVAGKEV